MSKHNVLLAGKNLEYYHSFHENIRVKSGAWDENGVFIYSTLSHVKYCLPNGDSGIIHSLANPIYIVRVHKQGMYFIDREQKVGKQRLNCSEYLFKLALHKRNFNDVKLWITNGRLCGNAVIGYLKQKGFPEVALHFVEDQQTRFNLALEYGHIEEAMTAAQELDERSSWNRLGLEALRQGNQQIVEMVYQKTKNFDALSFLYLITGNMNKLRKMLKIAEMRGDVMSRFHNALMLGQVEERVKIMAEMGQVPLAAVTARAHQLKEYMEKLEEQLQGNDILSQIPSKTVLLVPPVPLCRPVAGDSANWPLLTSTKKIFEKSSFEAAAPPPMPGSEAFLDAQEDAPEDTEEPAWGDEDNALDLGGDMGGGDWGGDLDLGDLGGLPEPVEHVEERGVNLTLGDTCQAKWLKRRRLPCDLVAAGDFEEALGLLKRRLGLMNVEPLEAIFKEAYWATCSSLPALPQMPSLHWPLLSEGSAKSRELAPKILFTPQVILDRAREALRMITSGKFNDALAAFRGVLQAIPISVAGAPSEAIPAIPGSGDLLWAIGWTFLPGARVRGSRRSSSVPRRAAEEDFVEALALLEKAGLGSYKSQLLEWCEEQGAASDEEVLENLEDLAADLGWSSEELEHVQEMQSKQQELFAYARSGDAEGLAKVAPTCDLSKREANGGTALHLAAAAGHGAAVARLLELNAPSLRDKDGRVPLHLAAFQGHHEVLSLLLDSKAAYVDATERRQGSSPLHSAARNGHEACVEALVEGKADLTLRDLMGRDALHWACFWGQPNTAELLIRHKADFSEANRDKGSGAGTLHWAAWRGHGEVLRLLLAQKADPNSSSE
ncbi:unnamed protein product, partial [Effrenium voratum]